MLRRAAFSAKHGLSALVEFIFEELPSDNPKVVAQLHVLSEKYLSMVPVSLLKLSGDLHSMFFYLPSGADTEEQVCNRSAQFHSTDGIRIFFLIFFPMK
tara:strand:- start:297 stop:593 length:297 start_codon:yes stop_codon:yes gene_type:complete